MVKKALITFVASAVATVPLTYLVGWYIDRFGGIPTCDDWPESTPAAWWTPST